MPQHQYGLRSLMALVGISGLTCWLILVLGPTCIVVLLVVFLFFLSLLSPAWGIATASGLSRRAAKVAAAWAVMSACTISLVTIFSNPNPVYIVCVAALWWTVLWVCVGCYLALGRNPP